MRKTKIICTLGPSTDKDGVLEELIKEGMNVAHVLTNQLQRFSIQKVLKFVSANLQMERSL